jgi:hypothetical protein
LDYCVTALIHSAITTPGQFRIGFLANSAVIALEAWTAAEANDDGQ